MLKPKIQHLLGQSVPCPLPAGQSPEPLAQHSQAHPGLSFSPSPVHTARALQSCRRAQEHCRGAQHVQHLLKRELKKKQKYLKIQRKTSSNSQHSCFRINEVSIIIFSRSHTLQVLVQNKRFPIISYSSGKLFPTQQPIPESCSTSTTEYRLSFSPYFPVMIMYRARISEIQHSWATDAGTSTELQSWESTDHI